MLAIDTSASRLSEIRSGRAEQLGVSRQELQVHLDDTGFVLSDELAATGAADMVLICVPTDVDAHGRPNSEALERTCAAAVRNARAGQTFVLTSATYVGGTRELLVEPLGERGLSVGEDVFVAFSPERVDPGATDHEPLAPRACSAASPRRASGTRRCCCTRSARSCTACPLLRPLRW